MQGKNLKGCDNVADQVVRHFMLFYSWKKSGWVFECTDISIMHRISFVLHAKTNHAQMYKNRDLHERNLPQLRFVQGFTLLPTRTGFY